jgi:EAL domain-containing protein (putative c-di-GMP-specific phosphodiesterase class I)
LRWHPPVDGRRSRQAGVTIAIDDFGTGHSSLQVLSRLPVDVLKIDRSFVRDLETNHRHRVVVQTTISLVNSLGLKTVAEDVETEVQAEILRDLGCDIMQGYAILRPAPPAEIGSWLTSFHGRNHPVSKATGHFAMPEARTKSPDSLKWYTSRCKV